MDEKSNDLKIIDEALRNDWKRKWNNAPHYKHTKLLYILFMIKTEPHLYLISPGNT